MAEGELHGYIRALDAERERCNEVLRRLKDKGGEVDPTEVDELERLHYEALEARRAWMTAAEPRGEI